MTKPKCNICEETEGTLQEVLLKLERYLYSDDPNIYDLADVSTILKGHYETLKDMNNRRKKS